MYICVKPPQSGEFNVPRHLDGRLRAGGVCIGFPRLRSQAAGTNTEKPEQGNQIEKVMAQQSRVNPPLHAHIHTSLPSRVWMHTPINIHL